MATLLIKPINSISVGNLSVIISGLDPTDHDCIVGQILQTSGAHLDVRWNLSGIARNQAASGNLDLRQHPDLVELAKKLGAS